MKQFIILMVFLVVVILGGTYLMKRFSQSVDETIPIGIAFSAPAGGELQLHVVVSMAMPRAEAPDLAERGALLWKEWIADHFDLRDSSGAKIEMYKLGNSNLINEREALNPEFYLRAQLKPGEKYTFDYIPVRADKLRYRYAFVAPAGGAPFERAPFLLKK